MAEKRDNIVIKHIPASQRQNAAGGADTPNPEPKFDKQPRTKREKSAPSADTRKRQYQIIAVLLACFAALLFVALISYTARDEANTEMTLREFVGIFRGDPDARAKADTTQNWLGIIGAILADFLYNHTFGFAALILPVIIVWWAKHLFIVQSIPRRVIKYTSTTLILCLLFAGITGTLQLITWLPDISREWSGAVGRFMAGIIGDIIGKIGALLVFICGVVVTVMLGTDIDVDRVTVRARLLYGRLADKLENAYNNMFRREKHIPEPIVPEPSKPTEKKSSARPAVRPAAVSNDDTENEYEYEPARIIRRSVEIAQNQFPDPIIRPTEQDGKSPEVASGHHPAVQRLIESGDLPEVPPSVRPMTTYKDMPPQRFASKTDEEQPIAAAIPTSAELQSKQKQLPPDNAKLTVELHEVRLPEQQLKYVPKIHVTDEEIQYFPPTLEILSQHNESVQPIDEAELKQNARALQEKLETFKIYIENLVVTPGPVVTQYEFVPAPGIKISQIENLADDIALALKARGIRIIAPVPGKGTVGIEIPNHKPSMVLFSSIIRSPKFHDSEFMLPLALGKTITGDVYCADLAKMPHLLIAGSTGSGKSVGINTLVISLIYKMHPKELKFVFIDPKKVELSFFGLLRNHFLAVNPDIDETIITTPANAVLVLQSVVTEMERRYDILAAVGQKNIKDYNAKIKEGKFRDTTNHVHRAMPYIVVVIDELADLMMTAAREVEEPITRLAQLARAVGIHLIVATQRPSVDVITGIIKANFPARIAYQVAQKVDSRTIIDMYGADQLLGNGDMLFLPGGFPKPLRIQNSYISTDEVEAICEYIGKQQGYTEPYLLPSVTVKSGAGKSGLSNSDSSGRDDLFEEAARLIVRHQQGSVSLIQRRLKVGYSRAGRIMDELEAAGIVGPFDGSKARSVLLESEAELEAYL
ncbi:DNA translocase FtsK [Ignavibacteria bacterium]|nr:DNA translocase FtsK [Bacteroidota bacterium]